MEPSSELLDALASQRQAVARLEAELAPRREVEAKTLAELEQKLLALRRDIAAAQSRARVANERIPAGEAELRLLEAGLSRAREAWVRVLEPMVISTAVLLATFGWGLTQGRDWHWQLAAGLTGLVAARLARGFRA
jgi:hypothetical protein